MPKERVKIRSLTSTALYSDVSYKPLPEHTFLRTLLLLPRWFSLQ